MTYYEGDFVKFLYSEYDIFDGQIVSIDYDREVMLIKTQFDSIPYSVAFTDILVANIGDIITVGDDPIGMISFPVNDIMRSLDKRVPLYISYSKGQGYFADDIIMVNGEFLVGMGDTKEHIVLDSNLYCSKHSCLSSHHDVVLNTVDGDDFFYCRNCKKEAK